MYIHYWQLPVMYIHMVVIGDYSKEGGGTGQRANGLTGLQPASPLGQICWEIHPIQLMNLLTTTY